MLIVSDWPVNRRKAKARYDALGRLVGLKEKVRFKLMMDYRLWECEPKGLTPQVMFVRDFGKTEQTYRAWAHELGYPLDGVKAAAGRAGAEAVHGPRRRGPDPEPGQICQENLARPLRPPPSAIEGRTTGMLHPLTFYFRDKADMILTAWFFRQDKKIVPDAAKLVELIQAALTAAGERVDVAALVAEYDAKEQAKREKRVAAWHAEHDQAAG